MPSLTNSYRPARIYPLRSSYRSVQICPSAQICPLTNCCRRTLLIRQLPEQKEKLTEIPKLSPCLRRLRLSRKTWSEHSAYSLRSPKQNRARTRLLHSKVSLKACA